MKQRHPRWGCRRIAKQIALAFGISINKDVIRRILAVHYRPEPGGDGPSWLTFLGHTKDDSLWSLDPFIERLIGTIRRECLDRLLFWTATDLEMKLIAFRDYYNKHRTHAALKEKTPIETPESKSAELKSYCWQKHVGGLYQTPKAA